MNRTVLKRLKRSKAFLFDMDGTLVLGDKRNQGLKPLPGAVAFIEHLNEQGLPYVIFTNGTPRTASEYQSTLVECGLPLRADSTMTPSSVAADCFVRRQHQRVLVLGCEGVWRPLADAGIDVVLPSDPEQDAIDAVYVGWYKQFVFGDLEIACEAVWGGARLYAASMVPFFARAGGRAIGSSFAIAGMIGRLTGTRAQVLGKPSLEAMRYARRRLDVRMEEIAVVGDDPQLEIPLAHRGKALAVGVATGLASKDDFAALPAGKRPHLTVAGVKELLELYRG